MPVSKNPLPSPLPEGEGTSVRQSSYFYVVFVVVTAVGLLALAGAFLTRKTRTAQSLQSAERNGTAFAVGSAASPASKRGVKTRVANASTQHSRTAASVGRKTMATA